MKQIINAKISRFICLFITVTCIAGMQSCKKNDPDSAGGSGTTMVKLVNTSTDAGASKLFIDGELRNKDAISFGTASGFTNSFAGEHEVSVQSASGVTLAKTTITLSALTNYSFFLTGTSGNYAIIPLADDVLPSTSTKAKVRFVQASSGLTSANLLTGSTTLFSALAYKSLSDYTEVTPGAYVFTVTNAGVATVLATGASITLQAGKTYTVYAGGLTGTTGATALAVNVTVNN